MELAGRHTFEATREIAWKALLDPQMLAKTVPGCERLVRKDLAELLAQARPSSQPRVPGPHRSRHSA